MKWIPTTLPEVGLISRVRHADLRGWLEEVWRDDEAAALGLPSLVQDNLSGSKRGVVRGLHVERSHRRGKLVTVVAGAIYDVAVDARPASATFGRWVAVELDADGGQSLWVPPGFAHGYQVLSPHAVVHYRLSLAYTPGDERAIRWDDPDLAIPWPIAPAVVSPRDAAAPRWREGE